MFTWYSRILCASPSVGALIYMSIRTYTEHHSSLLQVCSSPYMHARARGRPGRRGRGYTSRAIARVLVRR